MSEDRKDRKIEVVIRVAIALIVIVIGVFRHLYGWQETAGGLLESGFAPTLQIAFTMIHLTTILELIFVIWTIFGKLGKGYIVFYLLLFLIYSISFFTAFGNDTFVNSTLTSVLGVKGYPLAVLILLLVYSGSRKLKNTKLWIPAWLSISLCLLIISGYAIYYYPSLAQLKDQGSKYEVKYANWDKYFELVSIDQPDFVSEEEYVIGFFSTSCSHCNEAAKFIGVYKKRNPDLKLLGVFFGQSADGEFWESEDRITEFLERNNLEIPYLKMKDYEAISIADNTFPVMIEMKSQKPAYIFVGGEVNLWAFDHLFTKN